MKGALDVHRGLLAHGVTHEMVRLRRPVVAADDLPAALGLAPRQCVAVRVYVADGAVVAVALPAGEVPDPAALLDALGATTLRVATAAEVNAATDCAAGLVSPCGLPAAVALLADLDEGGDPVVYTAAAESGVALALRTSVLLAVTGARRADLRRRPLDEADRPGWDGVLGDASEPAPPRRPAVIDLDAAADRRTAPERPGA